MAAGALTMLSVVRIVTALRWIGSNDARGGIITRAISRIAVSRISGSRS
jgi:hypothetical protein